MEPDSTPSQDPDRPEEAEFGRLFLERLDEITGSPGSFPYVIRQALKAADREEFLRILREHQPFLSYAAIQRIRREPPDRLAELFELQRARARAAVALTAFAFLT